jgi:putative ATP-dependent endonuclease of OLD family
MQARSVSVNDFKDPSLPLVLDVVLSDLDDTDRGAFPDEVEYDGDLVTLPVRFRAEVDAGDPAATLTVERFYPQATKRRPSTAQLARFGFSFVPASRSMGRELAGSQGAATALIHRLDLTADKAALDAGFDMVRQVLASSGAIGEFRETLAGRLSESLPFAVAKEQVELKLAADLAESPLAGTTMTLTDAVSSRPITEHSDGVQALTVLALLGMDGARGGSIVAIDEPETHLHPTAQRALVSRLLTGSSQQLIATHNSAVAASAQPKHLGTIDRMGRIRQLPENAPIFGGLQLLRDWRQGLVEPLTAQVVLLVEGDSDRMVVEAVERVCDLGFAQADVAIFQLDGSGEFSAAWNFFGPPGLGMTVRAICDEDARNDWANVLGVEPVDIAASGVLVLNPDMEAFYVDALGPGRIVELVQAAGLLSETKFCARTGKNSWTELDRDDVVTAAGKRNKTPTAASIATGLTVADSVKLTPLVEFLAWLTR